jgi:hypothetical protein
VGDPNAPPLHAGDLFQVLAAHRVDYVVVGGLAAVIHGAGRVTFDIDVVPDWTAANLDRLAAALTSIDARLRVPGAAEPVTFDISAASLRGFEVSTWRTRLGELDIISGTPRGRGQALADYADLATRAQSRDAFGVTILIADLDDIIHSKQALAREPDLAALPELHRLRDRLRRHAPEPPDLDL